MQNSTLINESESSKSEKKASNEEKKVRFVPARSDEQLRVAAATILFSIR